MSQQLTDKVVKDLPAPAKGNRIEYDTEVKGFGVRITAAGTKAYVLNYRIRGGRERRYTIGSTSDWKAGVAREEARQLKKAVDRGEDPLGRIDARREAKTVADMCQRFEEEHLPKKRASTRRDYKALIDRKILPELKHIKVAELEFEDIDGLHRKITKSGAPYLANRTVAVLSKMLSLASTKWKWRADNPAKGIERNSEEQRHRYLSPGELAQLSKALAEHDDQQAANIVRLLLLTGARRGEVQAMKWVDVDLQTGVWTKPASTTKQKRLHSVPLSAPARQLLSEIKKQAAAEARAKSEKDEAFKPSDYVFPGRGEKGHRLEIKSNWAALCKAAGLVSAKTEVDAKGHDKVVLSTTARLHDLRHTYASVLASAGLSLPVIGALLGHSQPQTTARYAHLFDDPLRAATERVGAIIAGDREQSAEVVQMDGRRA